MFIELLCLEMNGTPLDPPVKISIQISDIRHFYSDDDKTRTVIEFVRDGQAAFKVPYETLKSVLKVITK